MALNLELNVTIVRNGTRMLVVDATGNSIIASDGKWNDAVAHTDVTGATLDITYPDGTTEQKDFITLGYFQVAIAGIFSYELFTEPNGQEKFPDGKYEFTYTITTSTATYTDTLTKYFYHNLEACISQLWYKLPDEMCDSCDYKEFLDSCLLAEGLYRALQAAAAFENDSLVLQLAEDATRICEINGCNCE